MEKIKEPKQDRSKALFQSILEATTQLLNKVNDSKVTTRGIAERAGVSIGSLYQYFTSADSVVSEVLRDRVRRDTDEILVNFQAAAGDPLELRLEKVFRGILVTHLPLGRVRTILFQRALSLQLVEFARDQVEGLTRRLFQELRASNELRADLDENLAVFLLSRTVFAVMMSATIEHEKMNDQQEALARELARMLTAYIATA